MSAFRILVWILQIDYEQILNYKWFQLKLKVGLSTSGLFLFAAMKAL